MNDPNSFDRYQKYLTEISKYREDYMETIIEKYVNTDVPGFIIDIRTLKVVQDEGKEVKDAKIPSFGCLNNYSCKAVQQIVKEIHDHTNQGHKISEKKFLSYAQQSFTKSRNVENEDLDTSELEFSKCEKKISTTISVRKNPKYKRKLNLFPYKTIPVDVLSISSSSFSEISSNDKKVSSSSNSNGDTGNKKLVSVDKQRKDKYPVKINSNSEIPCTNLTPKVVICTQKLQTPQNDCEEIVIRNSKNSYAINNRSSISSITAVQKNPKFKMYLNSLPYKNISVDDVFRSTSSFLEISNNDKKVSSRSNSKGDSDNKKLDSVNKKRKDKYPVNVNSNNETSCTNLASKAVICYQKWQTPQNNCEESVIHNSKNSYTINNRNPWRSIWNSYAYHYKELESVNKQRSVEYPAKFHCETLRITRAAKLRNPYYRKSQNCQNSCRDDYEDFVGNQNIDKYPTKSAFNNGLSIINYASRNNNVHYVKKLRNKRQTYLEDSKKIVENFLTSHTKMVNQNLVYNNTILKVPRVILTRLNYMHN